MEGARTGGSDMKKHRDDSSKQKLGSGEKPGEGKDGNWEKQNQGDGWGRKWAMEGAKTRG